MTTKLSSLCFPDGEKSCFFCCPPIREPEADSLDLLAEKIQLFRLNRRSLTRNRQDAGEIHGKSCWGLGFLDPREKLVGCLLHPCQNQGTDQRNLTGYRSKCAGTLCQEAIIFARLNPVRQRFYLDLTPGMDSFHYSSRQANPLMKILPWDVPVLDAIFLFEQGKSPPRMEFISRYGFFWHGLDYRLDSWLVGEIIKHRGLEKIMAKPRGYLAFRQQLLRRLQQEKTQLAAGSPAIPVHCLSIPLELSRLLKFGLNLWEATAAEVGRLQAIMLREIDQFNYKGSPKTLETGN
ncbi:MAG: hypothetical protein U9P07_00095 [Pseudomonadota bacterium]|nr:hypothetical protein [Pseudomonadota bacterium]